MDIAFDLMDTEIEFRINHPGNFNIILILEVGYMLETSLELQY